MSFENSYKGAKISMPLIDKAGLFSRSSLAALHMVLHAKLVAPYEPYSCSASQMFEVSSVHADSTGNFINSGSRMVTSKDRGTSNPALRRIIGAVLIKTFEPLRASTAYRFGDEISAKSRTLSLRLALPSRREKDTPAGGGFIIFPSTPSISTVNVCAYDRVKKQATRERENNKVL